MKNILITGGNGFIGSHLVDNLAMKSDNQITVFDIYPRMYGPLPNSVTFIQGSLDDINLVRRIFQDNNIDIVYHLAWTNIAETSLKNLIVDLESNVIPTINLLEVCREVELAKLIFLSSGGTIYGIPQKVPISENHPTNPINAYGVTKLSVEKYIKMYAHLYNLKYIILRPSVPYGPRQNPHRRQGAISVFIYNAMTGQPITFWGDGNEIRRDFFYIDDLIEALVSVQNYQGDGETVYNIGGSMAYSLNNIVDIIQEVLGTKINIRQEPARKFDVPNLVLDTSRAKDAFGWKSHVSLEQGILNTAQWIEHNVK